MANNESILILRFKTTDPKALGLLDGQPAYNKNTSQMYVGNSDVSNDTSDLGNQPAGAAHLRASTDATCAIEQVLWESGKIKGSHAHGKYSVALNQDNNVYQRNSFAIGGGNRVGRTLSEFNDFFWNYTTNEPLNGGQGYSASDIRDDAGANYSASNSFAFASGATNNAYAQGSSILGGANSYTQGKYSAIIGGSSNSTDASGYASVVVGGVDNAIDGAYSIILGGQDNEIQTPAKQCSVESSKQTRIKTESYNSSIVASLNTTLQGVYQNNTVVIGTLNARISDPGFTNESAIIASRSPGIESEFTMSCIVASSGTATTRYTYESFLGASNLSTISGTRNVILGGNESIASGTENVAIGAVNYVGGSSHIVIGNHLTANDSYGGIVTVGKYNSKVTNAAFVVGVGTSDSDRKNGLVVYNDGRVLAPNASYTDASPSSVLVTKGFTDKYIPLHRGIVDNSAYVGAAQVFEFDSDGNGPSYSFVTGNANTLMGNTSWVSGASNIVYGKLLNFAIGYANYTQDANTDGPYSRLYNTIAVGLNNLINHSNTFLFGDSLKTPNSNKVILGRYNDSIQDANASVIVGCGSSSTSRKNALVMYSNGINKIPGTLEINGYTTNATADKFNACGALRVNSDKHVILPTPDKIFINVDGTLVSLEEYIELYGGGQGTTCDVEVTDISVSHNGLTHYFIGTTATAQTRSGNLTITTGNGKQIKFIASSGRVEAETVKTTNLYVDGKKIEFA